MKKMLIIVDIVLVILSVIFVVLIFNKFKSVGTEKIDKYIISFPHNIKCSNDETTYEFKTDENYNITEIKRVEDNKILDNGEYKFFESYYDNVLGNDYYCEEIL